MDEAIEHGEARPRMSLSRRFMGLAAVSLALAAGVAWVQAAPAPRAERPVVGASAATPPAPSAQVSQPVQAAPAAPAGIALSGEAVKALRGAGFDVSVAQEGGRTAVHLVLRMADLDRLRPRLQELGYLNATMTAEGFARRRFMTALVYLTYVTATTIVSLYDENPGADRALFRGSVLFAEGDGPMQEAEMFSFEFDRLLYRRVNWESFTGREMDRVSRNYRMSPFATTRFRAEGF